PENYLGARVEPVTSSTKTLKDAINAALRYWIAHQGSTHYCLGSVAGPHPFPSLIRELQAVIGSESRQQFLEATGGLTNRVLACVGGGSNAIGMFAGFLEDEDVELTGVEAAGSGDPGCYCSATLTQGTPGVLHGALSYLLQSPQGQILPSHSLAPGLDYPGVGPEHAHLRDSGRVEYKTVQDEAAYRAFKRLARKEGIIPALESSHALAEALEWEDRLGPQSSVLVNLSGRGDKDLEIVFEYEDAQGGKEASHG
ncbi:MAG: pyridoxal-phosphate dependent enzyme, partial [Desulfohalobiaceae bacterium]